MELRNVLRKNKRGDVTDPMVFLILVGIIGISLLVIVFAGKTVTTALEKTPLRNASTGDVVFNSLGNMNERTIQFSFAMFMVFFIIGIIFSAFLAGEHPIFIFIFFIFTVVGILIAVVFSNVYGAIIENAAIASAVSDQKIFDFTFRNLPRIFVVVSMLGMVVMLSRIFGAPVGRSSTI